MNKREEQRIRTHEEILVKSENLFREIGYEKTTIQRIADSCGLSKGALYHHFTSKEEVLEEICRNHYRQLKEIFLPIAEDPEKNMHEKLQTVMGIARESRMNRAAAEFQKGSDSSQPNPDNILMEQIMGHYSEELYRRVFSRLFEQGRKEGLCDFEGDPEILAVFIHHLDNGMSRQLNAVLSGPLHQQDSVMKIRNIIRGFSFALSRLTGIPVATLDRLILTEKYLTQMEQILQERETLQE